MPPWLVLLLSLLCAGCGTAGEWRHLPASAEQGVPLYLVNHGLHVGLVVPAAGLERRLPGLEGHFPGALFYEVGWGDRVFYQTEEAGSGLAARALLWPTASAVHLVPLSGPVERYFPELERVELWVSRVGLGLLQDEMAASFRRDSEGRPRYAGRGLYGSGGFFESGERYHLLHTCNTWVAGRLAGAGVPMRPALAITAGGLMRQAKAAAAEQPCCAVPARQLSLSEGNNR
ncbi:DUF2459 domain-containing protein [Zobellella sp. DQSA1]|uniref:DUF2459 domain-containing protein n=1 Tax=Zobellella sp. DQSA1 TaxID=3342386 RepID=UPI0035C0B7DC